MARVRGIGDDDLDGLLAHFEALVMRILRRIARTTAGMMAGRSVASVDDLSVIPAHWATQVDAEVLPALGSVYRQAAQALVDDLAAFGHDVEALRAPDGADFLAEARNRLVGIGDVVWSDARDSLVAGVHGGEDIGQLAGRVAAVADVSEPRARVIARTEVLSANNAASFAQALMLNDPTMTKSWLATPDLRTRETHRLADGQSVAMRQPFEVGGAALLYPGDPTGPPDETASCRCSLAYDFDDEPVTASVEGEQDMSDPTLADVPLTAAAEVRTGAMVALIPSEADAARLAVDGGEPVDELHVTLLYLGDAADIPEDARQRIVEAVQLQAAGWPLVEADGFAVSLFNPGDVNDRETCVVLGLSGDELDHVHGAVAEAVRNVEAEPAGFAIPDQHAPWQPHITLTYTDDATQVAALADRVGPVSFDRLRVVFAGDATDIPLGTGAATDVPQVDSQADGGPSFGSDDGGLTMEPTANQPIPDAPVEDEPAAPVEHFHAVMHVEGVSTGLRTFAEGALTWRTPPFAFHWQRGSSAHMGTPETVQVGNVTRVERDGNSIHGWGRLDLRCSDGVEYARKLVEGFAAHVSIGLDESLKESDIEYVWPDSDGEEPDGDAIDLLFTEPEEMVFHAGRIAELSGVSIPAQAEATIEPTQALIDALAEMGVMTAAVDEAAVAVSGGAIVAAAYTITIPDVPPAFWFDEPTDVTAHGALTITDEGRIYGYVAPADVAHRSFPGRRVTVPMGRVDYSRWQKDNGALTASGAVVAGPITMECGHADPSMRPYGARRDHYDNACSVVAAARVGENRHGVWVAGALMPGVSADQVSRMMACRLSGDWQPHPERAGWQEFVAALLVPVPGFVSSSQASVRVREGVLVASAVPVRFAHAAEEVPPGPDLRPTLERLARSVGRDAGTRLAVLRERVSNGRRVNVDV